MTGPQLLVREKKRRGEESRRIFGIVRTKGGMESAVILLFLGRINGRCKAPGPKFEILASLGD